MENTVSGNESTGIFRLAIAVAKYGLALLHNAVDNAHGEKAGMQNYDLFQYLLGENK